MPKFSEAELKELLKGEATIDEAVSMTEQTPLQAEVERAQRKAAREALEVEFARQLDAAGISFERQYQIPAPRRERRYVYDFLTRFPARSNLVRVLVEVQGGVYQDTPTGHRSISGVTRDMDKAWWAQVNGYLILQLEPVEVKEGVGLTKLESLARAHKS